MAGHQVEQIVEAGRTSPPHQQQPEHRTVPPIKLRRVTDHQSRVVTSSAEQTTPEPMEAEPAIALRSNSRPVAVVRPRPQPSPINHTNVIINNAQMEPGVSESAASTYQNPVIQSATASYCVTMEYFDTEHYDQLVDKFDNQEYPLEIMEAATQVLETCQNRGIKVKSTLFSMLKFHVISRHHSDLKRFFEKCKVFFAALNLDVAKDTACLTNMLNQPSSSIIARISNSFINMGETEIQYIVKSPCLKNISSMCHGKSLPKDANVKTFVQWLPSDEKKNFLKLACRIFAGSGLPEQETLAKHEKILCHYFKEKLTNSGNIGSIAANSRECLLTPESREHNG